MRVLITGGCGFIGHNTAIYLKSYGYDVIVFDNLRRASSFAIERLEVYGIPIVRGDVLNSRSLLDVLGGVDVVVHAAAYISAFESMRRPLLYFRNNVLGTVNVAYASLLRGVKLVYVSSAAVYGDQAVLPISEGNPPNPISVYGLTKLLGEEVVRYYSRYGLKYVILRLFNVYGPGQSSEYAGVIKRFIDRTRMGKAPVIYGDGLQTRDFIHVRDVAEAVRLSIEKNNENEIINIASGKPITIRELAYTIIKYVNPNIKPIYRKQRPGDIRHSYADITKARKLLGFNPRISLEQGIRELIQT